MKLHMLHVIPDRTSRSGHGLNGYKEVIDSLIWGFEQLGHEVSYAVNDPSPSALNIVFGAQVMSVARQEQLPRDTIVYNFEQIRNVDPAHFRAEARYYADNFQIWDYSPFNLEAWTAIGTKYPVRTVPVGYAPILERIPKVEQDIDVLIYGSANDQRLAAFKAMCNSGLTAVFVHNLYGPARDALIGRTKTVANISYYTDQKVFEIVRVSYLLANHKAVVAHIEPDTAIESDITEAVRVSTNRTLIPNIKELARDIDLRREREARGYEIFRQRDVRNYLKDAFA